MAEEIRLSGVFQDEITPKLKKLNKSIQKTTSHFAKLNKSLKPLSKVGKTLNTASRSAKKFSSTTKSLSTGLTRVANTSSRVASGVGRTANNFQKASRAARSYSKSVKAASKANRSYRNPKVKAMKGGGGGGGGGAGMAGIAGGTFIGGAALGIGRAGADLVLDAVRGGFEMVANGFSAGMADQVADITATGSVFGALKGAGYKIDYAGAKDVAREIDLQIGKLVAKSPVPTEIITSLQRQLTDNLLPNMIKPMTDEGMGIKEASKKATGVLASLYEQIAVATPDGISAGEASKSITAALSGASKSKLAMRSFFMNNQVLLDELEKGGMFEATTLTERIKILRKGLNAAVPPEALAELRRTMKAAREGLFESITHVQVGLMGWGAQFAKGADKTIKLLERDANGALVMVSRKIRTPLELVGATLGPAMNELTDIFGAISENLGPITQHMAEAFHRLAGGPLQALTRTFKSISDGIISGAKTDYAAIGGEIVGNILSAISTIFDNIAASGAGANNFLGRFMESLGNVFPPEAQEKLKGQIIDFFSFGIRNITRKLTPLVLLALWEGLSGVFEGLWDAGLAGKFMALFGAFSLLKGPIGLVAGMFKSLGMFKGVIPKMLGGIASIGAKLLPVISGVFSGIASAIAAVAAPVLAVVGVVLIVIAVVRNFGSIMKVIGGIVQSTFGLLQLAVGNLGLAFAGLVEGIGELITKIPGMGGLGEKIKEMGSTISKVSQDIKDSGNKNLERGGAKVQSGTAAIAAQTKADFAKIGSAISGIVPKFDGVGAGLTEASNKVSTSGTSLSTKMTTTATSVGESGTKIGEAFTSVSNDILTDGASVSTALNDVSAAIRNKVASINSIVAKASAPATTTTTTTTTSASSSYNGNTSRTMPLSKAIATEQKNKPAGAGLVIANSSETILPAGSAIPAFSGFGGGPVSNNINVSITVARADNIEAWDDIAEHVAGRINEAMVDASYTEIHMT